jgi:hypothetical protein
MTTLTAEQPKEGMSLGHMLKDTWVITKRNLLRNVRLPQLLLFATIQPVMFLLLFNYVFGGALGSTLPPAAGGEYINWIVPGLLIQVATFGSGQTAVGLTEDLSKGVIDRFRSLPMARSAVLAGRTFSDVIRNGFVIGLMLVVGFLIGFRWQTDIFGMLGGLALALFFAYSLRRPSPRRSFRCSLWCSPRRSSFRPRRCPTGCGCSPTTNPSPSPPMLCEGSSSDPAPCLPDRPFPDRFWPPSPGRRLCL